MTTATRSTSSRWPVGRVLAGALHPRLPGGVWGDARAIPDAATGGTGLRTAPVRPGPAREFYTEKLGFELSNDIKLDNGMHWMTVRPPGNASQEFLLLDPGTKVGFH